MAQDSKIDALIVDADTNRRMRLKNATAAQHQFGDVVMTQSLDSAVERLAGMKSCIVAFLSSEFPQTQVSTFIQKAKSLPAGSDCAYISVLAVQHQTSSDVAMGIMNGLDAMLKEPFSADSLLVIAELAQQISDERRAEREAAAVRFLVTDLLSRLGETAR
ncbi:MAG: hypothetical protein K1X83_15665, partial [Oligoflexia bacterium]|nr:hypothetical protein [Oligoflexia bacterium]